PRLLAQRWRLDIGALQEARRALGPDRLSVVRFEDIVRDPKGQRSSIWQFLKLPTGVASRQVDDSMLRQPREDWKSLASGPISDTRSAAWQEELPTKTSQLVVSICRREMVELGYDTRPPFRSGLTPVDMLKTIHHRAQRVRKQAWIDRQRL
ncbi:MAG TPA: sulfotransferase, partial [Candidatus Paceibacterota bacterium]|nr:sulfotransferase [Candidatus Paceibacterota bacterium]